MPRLAPVTSATFASAITASWDSHRLCVQTRAKDSAAQISRHLVVRDHLAATHKHVMHAPGLGVQRTGATGHVVAGPGRLAADPIRIEHHEVSDPALGHSAAIAKAVKPSRDVGELAHALLEREQAALAHCGSEHLCRVVGVTH